MKLEQVEDPQQENESRPPRRGLETLASSVLGPSFEVHRLSWKHVAKWVLVTFGMALIISVIIFSDMEWIFHFGGDDFFSRFDRHRDQGNVAPVETVEDDAYDSDGGEWTFVDRPKLVNLGLPKSGTSSLRDQFKKLGYRTTHYTCNSKRPEKPDGPSWKAFEAKHRGKCGVWGNENNARCAAYITYAVEQGKKPFDVIEGEAFAQIDCLDSVELMFPQVSMLKQMMESYKPNEIIFTLTTRPTTDWLSSVEKWGKLKERFHAVLDGTIQGEDMEFSSKLASQDTPLKMIREFKEWHEQRVRNLVSKNGYKLIEFDLSQGEVEMNANFTQLARDIGIDPSKIMHYEWKNVGRR